MRHEPGVDDASADGEPEDSAPPAGENHVGPRPVHDIDGRRVGGCDHSDHPVRAVVDAGPDASPHTSRCKGLSGPQDAFHTPPEGSVHQTPRKPQEARYTASVETERGGHVEGHESSIPPAGVATEERIRKHRADNVADGWTDYEGRDYCPDHKPTVNAVG